MVTTSAPASWVDRPDDLRAVAEGLGLKEGYRAPDLDTPGRVFSISGMSGVGKSVLTCRLIDLARPHYISRPAVRVEVSGCLTDTVARVLRFQQLSSAALGDRKTRAMYIALAGGSQRYC